MRLRWSWNKVFFVAAALAAAGLGGFLAVRTTSPVAGDERLGHAPTESNPAHAEEEKAIARNRASYIKAFNAGDAKALAVQWTADGEFTDASGRLFRGRSTIEKEFTAFFAEAKEATLEIQVGSLRFLGPTVALETGSARFSHGGASSSAAYHIVHTKRDGKWYLASVRESAHAQTSNYENLRDLEWLVGTWTAKRGGQTLKITCEWAQKRNYLVRKYSLEAADGAAKTGMQIIGWDPVAGTIHSWVFDSDGGFGSEQWRRDGRRWVLKATAVTPDGVETGSTNILTQLDHDSFTWQSVQRLLEDVPLKDTSIIKVTRVKAGK
jgi:uncharacterized protein (TIGR02246 family)